MITEDYVSFEIAKLLKDKGFDEKVICYYDDGGSLNLNKFAEFKCCNQGCGSSIFSAPTLQMVTKWLREIHNLYITVSYNKFIYGTTPYYWTIETMEKDRREYRQIGTRDYTYQKYEDACEAAIKYCLENLI